MAVHHSRETIDGFEIHTLENERVSLSMAPVLGGKIVSLRDRISGRQWLDGWEPAASRRLWHPSDPEVFETGPGAGIDECLPTVLPCKVGAADLPDHGELWNQAPHFEADPDSGFLCRWNLKSLPLTFERRISIHGNEVRFDYTIENSADIPTPFLWAWHPLFTWNPGDCIHAATDRCYSPDGPAESWPVTAAGNDLSRAEFREGETPASKVFLGPLSPPGIAIHAEDGSILSLSWPTDIIPYAGIWITRGFWKGLHHWAIEPTNAPVDRLSDISEPTSVSLLAAREARDWIVIIKLEPT